MEQYDYKAEERKRFLKYFMVWIILAVISAGAFGIIKLMHKDKAVEEVVRNNNEAPSQRVYDYADVLTDKEEKEMEQKIANWEEMGKCDLILVTINEPVGLSDSEWTETMVNLADDFYDANAFGYDKPHGDGALLLDNWYHAGQSDSQAGAWLSTSGKIEYAIGPSEEDVVWRVMDNAFEYGAFDAYAAALKKVAEYGIDEESGPKQLNWLLVLAIPVIIAIIYACANMKQAPGKDTTNAMTYVPGGHPEMIDARDDFIRKSVSKVKIETSSSGSRSGGGGSYGHHRSSGGYSHGGGGHRR